MCANPPPTRTGVGHTPGLKAHKLLVVAVILQVVRVGRTDPAPGVVYGQPERCARVGARHLLPPQHQEMEARAPFLNVRTTQPRDGEAQRGGTESQGFGCTGEQQPPSRTLESVKPWFGSEVHRLRAVSTWRVISPL